MTGTRRKTNDAPPEDHAVPAEDLLSTSPFEGDLSEELDAAPKPRRRLPSVTVFLGAGVLIVGGFIGGVQADRHWGAKPSSNASDLLNQFAKRAGQGGGGLAGGAFGGGQNGPGLTGGGQGAGQGQGGGSGTTGTVKLVDGSTIWVQTPDGLVRVKTTGSTKVSIAKKATAKALKAGSPVTVQGTTGQDGTVTATRVSQGG